MGMRVGEEKEGKGKERVSFGGKGKEAKGEEGKGG